MENHSPISVITGRCSATIIVKLLELKKLSCSICMCACVWAMIVLNIGVCRLSILFVSCIIKGRTLDEYYCFCMFMLLKIPKVYYVYCIFVL